MQHLHGHPVAEGQGLIEYALILVLISVAVIVGLSAYGGGILSLYSETIIGTLVGIFRG